MRFFVRVVMAVVAASAIASCKGCDDEKAGEALPEIAAPDDPPAIRCDEPQLTPIISVHEHVLSVEHLPLLLDVAKRNDVTKVNLLPFWSDNVHAQNELQVAAAKADPEHVSSFVSIDAFDEEALSRLDRLVAAGATGVKMYSGYRRTYEKGKLTGPNAQRIYTYLEEHQLPLLMHTNGFFFEKELRAVLDEHPKLVLLCPHYCLLSSKPGRLNALLDDYPNLYSDVSFGAFHILSEGLKRIHEQTEAIRSVMRRHRHRFAFGMDNVVAKGADPEGLANINRAYRDMLEKESFVFFGKERRGLHLDPCTLESIYRTNPERFLAGKPPLTD